MGAAPVMEGRYQATQAIKALKGFMPGCETALNLAAGWLNDRAGAGPGNPAGWAIAPHAWPRRFQAPLTRARAGNAPEAMRDQRNGHHVHA